MRRHVATRAALLLTLALPATLVAQGGGGPPAPRTRQQMEQRLQQGIWKIAKQRIALSDDQMKSLEATAKKFDARRRLLVAQERMSRQSLRRELTAGDSANQDRVATALERLQQLQRERLDLMVDEQRELSGFMTPVQRAKFLALQEQLRRRVDKVRAGRRAGTAP